MKWTALFLLCLFPAASALASLEADGACTISTPIGSGLGGFLGDGGPATAARFNQPYAIAQDASGNFFIADFGNGRIRMVNTLGNITTIAGTGAVGYGGDGGPALSAIFNHPAGVAAFGSRVYVADRDNNRIRAIDLATGLISTVAGNGTGGFGGDGAAATAAQINNPRGVAVDGAGNIYIADSANQVIRKVTVATGVITTVAGTPASGGASGDNGPATLARLSSPQGVFLDGTGSLFIADSGNNRIRKVDGASGVISTVAGNGTAGFGGDGGPATAAMLNFPVSVVVNPVCGDLYIAEQNSNRIRMVKNGTINSVAGTGAAAYSGDGAAASLAAVNWPGGLVLGNGGNLFITDRNNNRIREVAACNASCFTPTPTPTLTITPTFTPTRDCASATIVSASFDIVADDKADIYINGNFLATTALCATYSSYLCVATFAVPAAWLNAAGPNLIATTDFDLYGGNMGQSYRLSVRYSDGSVQEITSDSSRWPIKFYADGVGAPAYPPLDGGANPWTSLSYAEGAGWNAACLIPTPCYGGWVTLSGSSGLVPFVSGVCCGAVTQFRIDSFRQPFSLCPNPSPTPSATRTPSPAWTPTPSNSPSATPSASGTQTATGTHTPSATPSSSRTATPSASPTASPTPSPTHTPTATPSRTPTASPSATPSASPTPTATESATSTLSSTNTLSATDTPSASPSPSFTDSPSATPTATETQTVTPSSTSTPSFTFTPTATETMTFTDTATLTTSPTATPTSTITPTFSPSPTVTPTPVPVPYRLNIAVYNEAGELVKTVFQGGGQGLPNGLNLPGGSFVSGAGQSLGIPLPGVQISDQGIQSTGGLSWDLCNDSGQAVGGGIYYVKVQATDAFGKISAYIEPVQVIKAAGDDKLMIFSSAGELVWSQPLSPSPAIVDITLAPGSSTYAPVFDSSGHNISGPLAISAKNSLGNPVPLWWNGQNSRGEPVASGSYTLEIVHHGPSGTRTVLTRPLTVIKTAGGPDLSAARLGPNPALKGGVLVLSFAPLAGLTAELLLYDVAGEMTRRFRDSGGSGRILIDPGFLAGGIYLAELRLLDGTALKARRAFKFAVIN